MTARTPEARAKAKRYRDSRRLKAVESLGGACERCGIEDSRVLEIDHIEGGGKKHRERVGTYAVYSDVIGHPWRYQLLCANCHKIKTYHPKDF